MASNAGGGSEEGYKVFVTDDIKYIGEIIKKSVDEFSKVLVKQNICTVEQSIEVAEDILLKGAVLHSNAPGGDDGPNPDSFRKKIPSFLFICALTNLPGSMRRKSEEEQRKFEGINLMKLIGHGMDSEKYRTIKVVDRYEEMLEQIKVFVSDKELSELPFVVFLGHGSEDGELCFYKEPWPHCKQAIGDVNECFRLNRSTGMPDWQLRFVFAQCYGHLADDTDSPGEIKECGIEYAYITSTSSKETKSRIRHQKPKISHLRHMKYSSDVHLKPDNTVLMAVVGELQKKLPSTYASKEYKQKIQIWLLEGPSQELPHNIQNVVQARRKQMVKFLCLGYTDPASSAPNLAIFNEFLVPPYDCVQNEKVKSEAELFCAIDNFLTGSIEVDMPVILVTGKGKKTQDDQLILHFSETDNPSAHTIYDQYKGVDELRMVFCCYNNDNDGKVWFSNALPPTTIDSKITEFTTYHYAIIKDGPKNQNIQLPSGSS